MKVDLNLIKILDKLDLLCPKVLVRVPYNCCSLVGLLNPYLLSTVNLLVCAVE